MPEGGYPLLAFDLDTMNALPAVARGDGSHDVLRQDLRTLKTTRRGIEVAHPLMLRAIATAKSKKTAAILTRFATVCAVRWRY